MKKPLVWFYLPGLLVEAVEPPPSGAKPIGFWLARGPKGGERIFPNVRGGYALARKYIGKIRYREETAEPDCVAALCHHTTGMPYPGAMSKAEAMLAMVPHARDVTLKRLRLDQEIALDGGKR